MKVIDLHQDLLFHLRGEGGVKAGSQTSIEMLEASEVRLVVASVFIHPDRGDLAPYLIEQELREYVALADRYGWTIVRSAADVGAVMDSDKLGLLLHIEGLNSFPLGRFETLAHWYELGWRSLGPVWNETNELGGGCSDSRSGLTDLGREVLDWCEQRGVVVDLAHMNGPTFGEGLLAVRKPVIVSHANVWNLCKSVRNLKDKQLRAVALFEGLIGLTFVNGFVTRSGRRGTVAQVADHIESIRGFIGRQYMAIGSDFGGILDGGVEGLESVADLPNLWAELTRRGWSEDEIEQVAWRNAARVLEKILP